MMKIFQFHFSIFIGKLKIENSFSMFQFLNKLPNYASRETVTDSFLISLGEAIASYYPQKRKENIYCNSLKRDRYRNSH